VASDFLTRIVHDKRLEVAQRRDHTPDAVLEAAIRDLPPAPAVAPVLRGARLRVIAEVKRSSPSAGSFNNDLDAANQAQRYAEGGAAAVSILTDGPYFNGSLADLRAARAVVRVPLLRKDFILDRYQLLEARAHGADFVLLIAAALAPRELGALFEETAHLGLEALVEVNTEEEARLAADLGAPLVGINNRDLHTFVVDMGTTGRLRPLLPPGVVVAALSGIKNVADGRAMRACGADAVLVGEALVRAADPAVLIAELGAIQ
jgi:indole-3-glycerol phosphate synthase